MPDFKPYVGPTRLVIAFDIGTTFSSISYCILEQGQVPEIHGVVTKSPADAEVTGDAKIPSILYYDRTGNVRAAGVETLAKSITDTALIEGWTKTEWWKLRLRPMHSTSDDLPPLPPGKSAVHVLADFIKYLFRCAKTYIEDNHLALLWSSIEHSVEFIFTYPNGLECGQQQLYHRAIQWAGLIPSMPGEGRSRVHMLSEGEASLHFCLANLVHAEIANQTASQGVVIVDAGGGTIDLSMFSMTSDPILCEEIAPAECQLQGSVFVTRRAKVLLEEKLQGWKHLTAEGIAEFTRNFDQLTKPFIETDKEPAYVNIAGRRTTDQKHGISFGKLKLTGEEATGLFNDSISAIISAFEQQQKHVKLPITMGFLVGGFASNDWLWSQIRSYFRDRNINIYRIANHIDKAVAHGAVLSVVDRDHHMVASRVACATYGTICSVPVHLGDEEHFRRKDKWARDEAGKCYVEDYFNVKIHKGNQVYDEMEFRDSYSITEADPTDFGMQVVRLVCYRGELSKPEWLDQDPSNFSTHCYILVDLSEAAKDVIRKKMPSGRVYYQLDFDVIVYFGFAGLEAQICWKKRGAEHRILAMVSFESFTDGEGPRKSQQPRKVAQLREQLGLSKYEARSVPSLDSDQVAEEFRLDEIPWTDSVRSLSDSPSEMITIQQDFADPLKDSGSVPCQLEETLSICDKRACTITSLTSEDAVAAQQIAVLRREIKILRDDVSAASSRILELEQHQGVVHKELQTRAALIEEKDRIIAALTAEVAQLKPLDADKTKLITTAHGDLQPCIQPGGIHISPVGPDGKRHRSVMDTCQIGDYCVPESFDQKHPMETIRREHGWAQRDSPQTVECRKHYDAQSSIPGIVAFQQWMSEGSSHADKLLVGLGGNSLLSSVDIHNALTRNALLEARAENWSSAYDGANKSIETRPSAMGYIAKALSQAGSGELEEAMQVFDLAFGNRDSNESTLLLLVVKAIILFIGGKCDDAITRTRNLIGIFRDDEMAYCCIRVLGEMYMMQGDYGRAVESLEQGRNLAPTRAARHLETISIIFGWTFEDYQVTMLRCQCEISHAAGRAVEAAQALLKILNTFEGKSHASRVLAEWVVDLKEKCTSMLERLGDSALGSGRHKEAITHYSSALSLSPSNLVGILVKRSKARSSAESWEDALTDADEVRVRCVPTSMYLTTTNFIHLNTLKAIKLDPSSYQGYERKYVALYGVEKHVEANNALLRMFSIIEKSRDDEIRRLRENYTAPHDAINAINTAIREISDLCPLVLIDLTTGQLCDAEERIRIFKSENPFKRLVSKTVTEKLDHAQIRQAAAEYFKWAMFSHRWEGKEPTFRDVNLVESVWELDHSPLNEKLRNFCTTAYEDGHRWAWSDTCCIDKNTSATLSQSLTSMYRWYEEAAETLVYLADVPSSADLGYLMKSLWMTRAWTLQELLASKVIRFYNKEWKPYLNDKHRNHKESPSIRQELAQAMGVNPDTIFSFRPESLGVREKLRLASARKATRVEDIAYSLIGIFSSDIAPRYGLGKVALGQLLENIVARTGDVTVIAWTGKPSLTPYNSALPDSLDVYSQMPYSPPAIKTDELDTCIEQLRTSMVVEDAVAFYDQVIQLPPADFRNRRLHLPCIMFPVSVIGVQELDANRGNLYRARVSGLGEVEFRTEYLIQLRMPRKLVFIHAWLHDLRGSLETVDSDHEWSRFQADFGMEGHVGYGGVADDSDPYMPVPPLHAEPSTPVNKCEQALRLFARFRRPFNALLLNLQPYGQYKRIATEHEIIISGVQHQTNPKDLQAKVLEII